MVETDKRALQQWDKSDISYVNYSHFISTKTDKLTAYQQLFEEINVRFNKKNLNNFDNDEITELIGFSDKLIKLTDYKSENKIDGFSVSFLTTLLHFYFPNLYPILDRRVLNGLKLISEIDLDKQRQVKNLKDFYPKLIIEFKQRTENKTIRELDKELFITKFLDSALPRKNRQDI